MKLRLLLALVAASSLDGVAHAAIRTVAVTGQQAPGAPLGVNFTHLYSTTSTAVGPAINDVGRVAFAGQAMETAGATLTGIWSDATGALAAIARSGTQAAGASSGINFATFKNPLVNTAGHVAFDATLTGPTSGNSGVWAQRSGALSLVAQRGSSAPGTTLNYTNFFNLGLNGAGQTVFRAGLNSSSANNVGVWSERGGAVAKMVQAGDQAPGTPNAVLFEAFPAAPIAINDSGRYSFKGFVTHDDRMGIWTETLEAGNPSPTLTLVARENDPIPAPGFPASARYGFIGEPTLNQNGDTAFVAHISGVANTQSAVFLDRGETLLVVAWDDQYVPNGGFVRFNSFSSPLVSQAGDVAFFAGIEGSGITSLNDTGIWSRRDGVWAPWVREGYQAPGAESFHFNSFANLSLNSSGQTAFSATLRGDGITTANDVGIWARGRDGLLQLVAREGNQIEISPGVNRTIAELFFAGGASTEDGRRVGFNDHGEVAFLATFTDGSSGIFVSDVAKASSADFDGDADVDGADFLVWQRGVGITGTGSPANGDANADGNVDAGDLTIWKSKFAAPSTAVVGAAVPEPGAALLGVFALTCVSCVWRSRPS
jgi:hypothetical protein